LIDQWKEQGIYDDIKNGNIHIIWTGGEPTIPQHQEAIVNFTKYFINQDNSFGRIISSEIKKWSNPVGFYEIETNGTFYINEELITCLSQINCSPKLSNSGMTEKQRIIPEAIKRIMQHGNYQFKFVISTEDDVKEIFRDFVEPFNIPLKNVVCMPGLDDVAEFEERTRFVMEMAKKYKFRGLTRLHIAAWNKTLNV
jgi:organic radical activating enzyme